MKTIFSDCWIDGPKGRTFVRQWSPAEATADATPIVLIHDSLGCVELWRGFPEALSVATGRRVIAYDRLGFGHSDALSARPSLAFIAEEAASCFPAVCDGLGIKRFIVVGHSVGGAMACHVAAQNPCACKALVTMGAQAFVEEGTLKEILVAKVQFDDPAEVARLIKYHGYKAPWVIDAWTGCWLDPAFRMWSLAQVLPCVACPVLALHGECDPYGSVRHPAAITNGVGGSAEIRILKGAGHVLHREQPGWVCEQFVEFLAAHSPR